MPILRLLKHPIFIFVICQILWIAILLLWVLWSVDLLNTFHQINLKRIEGIDSDGTITVLVVGCILLGMLLVGSVTLFIFGQKQSYLFRAQQDFLSSVTHELRSPLASLQLTFETLNHRKVDPDTQKKLFENAGRDIERLGRLVNQVLISARLDRGIAAFTDEKVEDLQLKILLEQAMDRAKWLDSNLTSRVSIRCPSYITIYVSKPALMLVLSNLIENAIKYSDQSSPIEIKAWVTQEGRVQISIIDQGLGIQKEQIQRIFRLFQRGPIASKKAIPGTGVGLFIVKGILKVLGGKVWAESDGPGKGSTFNVLLPKGILKQTPNVG